ncbi:hypothetical protein [Methylobacterium sp. 285MFTsu5.1]|uniref:hypothetical protein n=1 Tax=Methylobacterium sp. 285MFTsu5.1 TaxID=1172187 RepID=UPI00131A0EC0|nr:hypothetical protein [Methylobacterium sp. 285MFTsu5.1]
MRYALAASGLLLLATCSPSPYADQPESQKKFVEFLHTWRSTWGSAINSIQKENMPQARDNGLCQFGKSASNWVGVVESVGTFYGGKFASINIKIAPDITVRTGGDLGDDKFKIDRGSQMFKTLSQLGEGMKVTFSGFFGLNDNGCAREVSLTNNGAFNDPEFIFSFSHLERKL